MLSAASMNAITISWDPNIDQIQGYKIHYGTVSGTPDNHQDVGNVTTSGVDSSTLQPGSTVYFTVTSYNNVGESGPSNEVSYVVPAQGPAATFVREDATTQGNWKGVYGANGRAIYGDSIAYPSWAQVTMVAATPYTWAASTTNVRALRKFASAADRIASSWSRQAPLILDVNLTDGNSHEVSIYFLDWDNLGRSQRVDITDADTGAVLDTRTVSSFVQGKYIVWSTRGHVKITMTKITGINAVFSGLFL